MFDLRTLAGQIRSFFDPRQVGYVIFYVTNRCNFRCNFCFYSAEIEKGRKPDELTLDEIRRIAPTIGPLLQLSLTGGEPFIRQDFAEVSAILIEATRPRFVTIPTNAWLTDRIVSYLERILPAYPNVGFRLVFSVEGIGSSHDELRSMPGSFDRIRKSFDAVGPLRRKFRNLTLDSNSVFTARSEATLLDTLKILSRDWAFDNLSITYARGSIKEPALKKVARERYEEINGFLESLQRRREKRFLYPVWRGVRDVSRHFLMRTVFDEKFVAPCVAGRKLLVISETGEVLPCEILGRSMGSLRAYDFDLRRLLAESANRDLVRWIKDSRCRCSFECALASNVVWNVSSYPRLLLATLRNIGSGGTAAEPTSPAAPPADTPAGQ